ncbi:MAG: hypothetical protein IPK55_11715, partial [Streptococcus sp.]|nr:hypothetical protein [Streptococcus sp.]
KTPKPQNPKTPFHLIHSLSLLFSRIRGFTLSCWPRPQKNNLQESDFEDEIVEEGKSFLEWDFMDNIDELVIDELAYDE